ncbi:DNA-binding domain-containing protein [uncultured Cohaesibacter sp.]|uniref:HvfC/BufC N-terminal domain-containing protein n=1 Tax=uncultured Cohaesibacter sp. TaxID=1002546 RepID=UPI002AAB13BF|nr:DNA-binding domain-containing protein [uncultured Cohaesibacter sp.]
MSASPSLHTAQASFSSALIKPDHPTPDDVVGPKPEKKAQKRFGVYRNNVIVSLTEALMASFPTIKALVGEDYFRAMARVYITSHPPRTAMLSRYGDLFASFLDVFEPVQAFPYLGDVAGIEFAWQEAYHAADQSPLDPTSLQQVPPDRLAELTFTLHPACRLLASPHPAYSIWAAHKQDNPQEAMASLPQEPEDCLITRPYWDVMTIKLPAGGFAFLKALREGLTLRQAAAAALEAAPAFDFARNLGGLLETGVLAGLHLPSIDAKGQTEPEPRHDDNPSQHHESEPR